MIQLKDLDEACIQTSVADGQIPATPFPNRV